MIFLVESNTYPNEGQFIEELKYLDENEFEWRIARIQNGFMVKYFGPDYFKDTTFECHLKSGECIRVKNTNCVFIQDLEFETFAEMRDILKNGYTDEIWETFEELLCERFECDKTMLQSEVVQ